jgi:hypothetical protein
MSVAKNNIYRSVAPKSMFESAFPVLSTAVTYNQGDILYFDDSANLIKPIAASGDAATVLGVARQTVVSGKVASAYSTAVDAAQGISDVAGPVYGVVAFFTLKTSDAFNPGDKVYPVTTDPQIVTSTDPGNALHIGIFQDKAVASAAAGQTGNVLVGCRFGLGSGDIQY